MAMTVPMVSPPGASVMTGTKTCTVTNAVCHNPPAPCEDWQSGWVPPATPVQWVAPYSVAMQHYTVDGGKYSNKYVLLDC